MLGDAWSEKKNKTKSKIVRVAACIGTYRWVTMATPFAMTTRNGLRMNSTTVETTYRPSTAAAAIAR